MNSHKFGYHIVPTRCDCRQSDVIDGKYTVISELGSGSFGQVFKVKDATGNVGALKLLRLWDVPSDIRDALKDRFEMEFKTGRIPDKNLVHSFDSGYLNGNPYFVMEYCPGGDICKYIGRRDVDLTGIALDILNGLNALHTNGKVHRDLKPENVLIREDGSVALTDFGISGDKNKRLTERNIFGKPYQMFGTYAYMPPEQSNRERGIVTVLPTTDLFSFGVLMYQLLTGELPFGRLEDQNDLAKYLMNSKAGKWNMNALAAIPGASRWVTLISSCLKPSWKDRVQSARTAMEMVPGERIIAAYRDVNNREEIQESAVKDHEKGVFLSVTQGRNYGVEYKLNDISDSIGRDLLTVGLEESNNIVLKDFYDSYTSRRHFSLEKVSGNTWIIRDGQWNSETGEWRRSTNGTWKNSAEVDEGGEILADGDIVSAGEIKLKFNIF